MIHPRTMSQYGVDGVRYNLDKLANDLERVASNIRGTNIKIPLSGTVDVGQTSSLYALREISGNLSFENSHLLECISVLQKVYDDVNLREQV